ncbi:MAG TPA: cobalt-precorrin-5B (C(1))-methyltransferase CbiD [Firmicutes bacterium]|nr:cobalt-precorrin-5B (C(1))-methyltransferase CbiD [Bacillota bacterium]
MLEEYVIRQNKKLRRGYTTGSCAAAAAKAAAGMLLGGSLIPVSRITTPGGIALELEILDVARGDGWVSCAVKKDGGDDPDATNGILICARVSYREEPGILIDGGAGVGRVTLPGLDQPVGAAAINRVPRSMILSAVQEVCGQYGCERGLSVIISVPDGEAVAGKTFNPRLGIIGGISILGTTGIVEPMSEDALIKTIEVEMKVLISGGNDYIMVIPGNYGKIFSQNELGIPDRKSLKCSNYIGATVDLAAGLGVKGILFVGHIGKLIKLSGGIMNTHSREADCRMELMAAAALRAGAGSAAAAEILDAGTTDEGIRILKENGCLEAAMDHIMDRIAFYLNHRCMGRMETEAMVFSNVYGILGQTKGAAAMLSRLRSGEKEE